MFSSIRSNKIQRFKIRSLYCPNDDDSKSSICVLPLWSFPLMTRLRTSDVITPLKKSQQPLIHREGSEMSGQPAKCAAVRIT